MALGFLLTRLLASLLFGVSPTNPLIYLGVCVGLTLIAVVACYWPARTAVKVNPLQAQDGVGEEDRPGVEMVVGRGGLVFSWLASTTRTRTLGRQAAEKTWVR